MKVLRYFVLWLLILGGVPSSIAVESGMYRLLSISESEKLILVSRNPDKTKFLLDVKAAKITVDGKPAELEELNAFSVIQVKWNESDDKRNGVRIDGIAVEIEVESPKKPE
ncbi:MAG: hypothetical protein P8Z37_06795 [Acidobacteriota bacterium]|jgi:hypothetical protein